MTPEEEFDMQEHGIRHSGCVKYVPVAVLIVAFLLTLSGCRTSANVVNERQTSELLLTKVDSLAHMLFVTQQDSSLREYFSSQLQTLREKNDTSHTVVVDTAGRVIKETLIIRTEKESTSETERREREVLIHRLEVMDSTLMSMQSQMARIDSLLYQEQKVVEVNTLYGWQRWMIVIGFAAVFCIVLFVAWKIRGWFPP